MALSDIVNVAQRFQRSIRIDSDLGSQSALDGFICPRSSTDVLLQLANHVSSTGQGAFTWTGPYGSGKSSLVIALSALLNGDPNLRNIARKSIGNDDADIISDSLPLQKKGWKIVPIVGRRSDPKLAIIEALEEKKLANFDKKKQITDEYVVNKLLDIANEQLTTYGGLILFIDEMGKFLESAARDESDIYIFQQLAEAASRSNRRLIVIGILHQSFHEYASRLSRELRDEWSKIQGRYIDLAINTAGEEQIELLTRAIESRRTPKKPTKTPVAIANQIAVNRKGSSLHLAQMLEETWPLHPVVSCLLGPISRRRFGQNQRSIFGFLNSAEPHGFQDFIRNADDDQIYLPVYLWDYLRINLEPSILASPDGHKWSLAVEAVERCDSLGGTELELSLLKLIALVDLFKERSGLVPCFELLEQCCPQFTANNINIALERLQKTSFIIYRKFNNSFSIYAGSDFDIEQAVEAALQEIKSIDFGTLRSLAGLQPILAKRFYYETGALWWFDVEIVPLSGLLEYAQQFTATQGTIGAFLLAIPTDGEAEEQADKLCQDALDCKADGELVVGVSQRAWVIIDLARELLALQKVLNERSELSGDAVARREVIARRMQLQGLLEAELSHAFDKAEWYSTVRVPQTLHLAELNSLASELAKKRFPKSPRLHNELLNRVKPSSSAIAAQNVLLKRMVMNENDSRLGIDGFPAEGGLYNSLLLTAGIHQKTPEGWRFIAPEDASSDPYNLRHLWKKTTQYLQKNMNRSVPVAELYSLWRKPPFGVKDGLMSVIAVAYIQSLRSNFAFYRQGAFQARFRDLDVECLAKDPSSIQLRWMDLTEVSKNLLSGLAEVVREFDSQNELNDLQPIDVARGLIAIFDHLQPWTKRTMNLSGNAKRVRDLFKQAKDPNKFLFDDIPSIFGEVTPSNADESLNTIITQIHQGLDELCQAYPIMLKKLLDIIINELQVPNASPQALAELRERAENIKQVGGDFRLDAFIGRLAQFNGGDEEIEGLASLAANKPPRDWIDLDLDRAAVELTDLSQKFIRLESFARVKGRANKRHAMAVVVGIDGQPTPFLREFDIEEKDKASISGVVTTVEKALLKSDNKQRNIILAALAELSAKYMRLTDSVDDEFPRTTKIG
ncbi:MAG: ATP-binding protein [Geobacter sp.]|nr:MAG: ATP-binding protein [Geobacter sp.]